MCGGEAVPGARNRVAAEEVEEEDECGERDEDDDYVAGCTYVPFSGEAEIEEEHRGFGEVETGSAEGYGGVVDLEGGVSMVKVRRERYE